MMDFFFGTPMLVTPQSYSHLYGLFMGICFLGIFTILKMGAGVLFDALHDVQGRFRSLLLCTPLACAILYFFGIPFLWSVWAMLFLVITATFGEVALIAIAQRDELTTKQISLFLFPLHVVLFFITFGLLRWIEFLYATNYGFGVIMAFTIYVVGKLLMGSIFLTLGRITPRTSLVVVSSALAVLPLLWIGFAQQFQMVYMVLVLLYAALCEVLLLRILIRETERLPLLMGVSVATNVGLSLIVLLLLTQSFITQTL